MSCERKKQNENKKTCADEDLDETQDGDEPVEKNFRQRQKAITLN
jgi:hypothetical protein